MVESPTMEVSRSHWNKPGIPAVNLALCWAGDLQRRGVTWIFLSSHRMDRWNGQT